MQDLLPLIRHIQSVRPVDVDLDVMNATLDSDAENENVDLVSSLPGFLQCTLKLRPLLEADLDAIEATIACLTTVTLRGFKYGIKVTQMETKINETDEGLATLQRRLQTLGESVPTRHNLVVTRLNTEERVLFNFFAYYSARFVSVKQRYHEICALYVSKERAIRPPTQRRISSAVTSEVRDNPLPVIARLVGETRDTVPVCGRVRANSLAKQQRQQRMQSLPSLFSRLDFALETPQLIALQNDETEHCLREMAPLLSDYNDLALFAQWHEPAMQRVALMLTAFSREEAAIPLVKRPKKSLFFGHQRGPQSPRDRLDALNGRARAFSNTISTLTQRPRADSQTSPRLPTRQAKKTVITGTATAVTMAPDAGQLPEATVNIIL
jgi:hypothetical protein